MVDFGDKLELITFTCVKCGKKTQSFAIGNTMTCQKCMSKYHRTTQNTWLHEQYLSTNQKLELEK